MRNVLILFVLGIIALVLPVGGPVDSLAQDAQPGREGLGPERQPTATATGSAPTAAVGAALDTPHGRCTVAPRSIDALVNLAPEAGSLPTSDEDSSLATRTAPTPLPTPTPATTPADAATVDAVTATVEEVFACVQAGDLLRASALFSERYLGHQFFTAEATRDDFLLTASCIFGTCKERGGKVAPFEAPDDEGLEVFPRPRSFSTTDLPGLLAEMATTKFPDLGRPTIDIQDVRVHEDGRVEAVLSFPEFIRPDAMCMVVCKYEFVFVRDGGTYVIDQTMRSASDPLLASGAAGAVSAVGSGPERAAGPADSGTPTP